MKISIITPTYNSEKYLQSCLQSVKDQDYPDIEHIVVDGNSSDKTIDIIHSFHSSVSKYISESDGGMYDAVNKGIKLATGDFVGVLNSDDMFASNDVISCLVEVLEKHGADSVYGDLDFVSPGDTTQIHRRWIGEVYNRKRFKYGWMPAHPTFYLRRELVEKLGGYETHFITSSDYEFMCRMLYHHHISSVYLNKVLVKMRLGGASNGSIKQRLRANRRDFLAMKKNEIPFPFFISLLKPITKLHQYNWRKKLGF